MKRLGKGAVAGAVGGSLVPVVGTLAEAVIGGVAAGLHDSANNLVSQLLAAKLNLSVWAETSQAAVDAAHAGQSLLASIGFDVSGAYPRLKDEQLY